ncbi:hypothetical protein GLOIN_2v1616667 [Rhizophagus clarus]|uniref:Uncharacterized protein n=2 Tax=Rhizophagus clarus TaxID=94130 RepID=A0A8H3KVA6_9GLOM|nr:hypothetical protein GLOIN_2v1616667 [Rhizophagus clarus]
MIITIESIKRLLFIFLGEQTSNEIDLNNIYSSISNNETSNIFGIRRISGHIKNQKSFESSMRLIKKIYRTIMTKRNHSDVSASREVSDATTSITVVVVKDWNKPDIDDNLNADERKDYQIRWKSVND